MPRSEPFETHADRYDEWFEAHEAEYRAELAALEPLVPAASPGLEVGVGTGRFAGPLEIGLGLDPAAAALDRARERGIEPVRGVAEQLPVSNDRLATVLLVTTVCFVDDLARSFREAGRVLQSDGSLVLGYIDRDSPLGERYADKQDSNPFYRAATFKTTDEILETLEATGFAVDRIHQTLFEDQPRDAIKEGYGEGSFVGIAATPDGE
jgi:SAM-dependent methyltransferase